MNHALCFAAVAALVVLVLFGMLAMSQTLSDHESRLNELEEPETQPTGYRR